MPATVPRPSAARPSPRDGRAIAGAVRADLHRRRWLRVHALLVGLLTWVVTWGFSHALMATGVSLIGLRLLLALCGGYLVYLLLLRLWCRWLLSRDDGPHDPGLDGLIDLAGSRSPGSGGPPLRSGGGGDFGGGGAEARFDAAPLHEPPADAPGIAWPEAAPADALDAGGAAGSALEALGSADEGAVVAIPLALLIGAVVLLAAVAGFAVFGLFGVEILLGVAVEIALASAGTVVAYKAQAEGWLAFALRRTIKPFLVCLCTLALLGTLVDLWLPQARSLPHAVQLWRAAR